MTPLKIVSIVMSISLIVNGVFIFTRPDTAQFKARIDKLNGEKTTLEEHVTEDYLYIDSLLSLPPVKPKIIKEYFYEKINEKYPSSANMSNDSIVKSWTRISEE
jgi:hypothetical protein